MEHSANILELTNTCTSELTRRIKADLDAISVRSLHNRKFFPITDVITIVTTDLVERVLNCNCDVCIGFVPRWPRQTLLQKLGDIHQFLLVTAVLIYIKTPYLIRYMIDQAIEDTSIRKIPDTFQLMCARWILPSQKVPVYGAFVEVFKRTRPSFTPLQFPNEWDFANTKEDILPIRKEFFHGSGTFGEVSGIEIHKDYLPPSRSRLEDKHEVFAVKCIERKHSVQSYNPSKTLGFIKLLRNPNLVAFHCAYTTPDYLFTIFDFHPHTLQDVFDNDRVLLDVLLQDSDGTKKSSGDVVLQRNCLLWRGIESVALGLKSIHEGIGGEIGFHYDLKPTNILVTTNGKFLISDFGLAIFKPRLHPNEQSSASSMAKYIKTTMYEPPDHIDAKYCSLSIDPEQAHLIEKYLICQKYDIWSLACIILESLIYLIGYKPAVPQDGEISLLKYGEGVKAFRSYRCATEDQKAHGKFFKSVNGRPGNGLLPVNQTHSWGIPRKPITLLDQSVCDQLIALEDLQKSSLGSNSQSSNGLSRLKISNETLNSDSYLNSIVSILWTMFSIDASLRPSSADIVKHLEQSRRNIEEDEIKRSKELEQTKPLKHNEVQVHHFKIPVQPLHRPSTIHAKEMLIKEEQDPELYIGTRLTVTISYNLGGDLSGTGITFQSDTESSYRTSERIFPLYLFGYRNMFSFRQINPIRRYEFSSFQEVIGLQSNLLKVDLWCRSISNIRLNNKITKNKSIFSDSEPSFLQIWHDLRSPLPHKSSNGHRISISAPSIAGSSSGTTSSGSTSIYSPTSPSIEFNAKPYPVKNPDALSFVNRILIFRPNAMDFISIPIRRLGIFHGSEINPKLSNILRLRGGRAAHGKWHKTITMHHFNKFGFESPQNLPCFPVDIDVLKEQEEYSGQNVQDTYEIEYLDIEFSRASESDDREIDLIQFLNQMDQRFLGLRNGIDFSPKCDEILRPYRRN